MTATATDPVERVISALESRGFRGNAQRNRYPCPIHGDRDRNLVVGRGDDGAALVYCHSHGCSYADIMEAIGLSQSDGFADSRNGYERPESTAKRIAATYDYWTADGELAFQTVRYEPKTFRQRRPDGKGDWTWNLEGVEPVPYRLPDLLRSEDLVVICEGEKDVDRLHDLGIIATCNHGGSGNWKDIHSDYLADRDVAIIPDNDMPGIDHAQSVAESLQGIASSVKVLDPLPESRPKGDVSDWLDNGGKAEELRALIADTPEWTPRQETNKTKTESRINAKPVLQPEALYGLAGDVVRAFDPLTEADQAGILASYLVAFGNACGPGPHCHVSETRHGVNLFATLCGETSRSRKGTTWGPIARIFDSADRDWLNQRKASGIGSGETIVSAIRDASDPKEDPKTGATIIEDAGIEDKRLMIQEGEFASILKVSGRDGSILSEIVRKAWDSESPLRNMTKKASIKATDPHVSILGHITLEELRRTLTETEQANGLANRFLWVYVCRSKLLPDAPRLDAVAVGDLAARTRKALDASRRAGEIKRDAEATEIWRDIYADLSRDYPGMFGSLTARAEAQVLRLSMVYALLDCSKVVRQPHLQAAVAFWAYCEASTRYIFGDRTGDPVADRIRDALSSGPLSENAIRDIFSGHQKRDRIQSALEELRIAGYIDVATIETGGRPAKVWRSIR